MPKEESVEMMLQIEMLFQRMLEELRETKDTEVDCEHLFSLVEIYEKHYDANEVLDKRWTGYIDEILIIFEKSIKEQENLMRNTIELDAPITAYEKAAQMSRDYQDKNEEE